MTAQFLYQFKTGGLAGETSITFCYFRPWESCPTSGNYTQTVKVVISETATASQIDLSSSLFEKQVQQQ
jgi:hypothetical protein